MIILILFWTGAAFAEGVFIELKGSYFTPSDQYFKDIYGGGICYGGEIGITVWKGLSVWAGGDFFAKKGKMTFTGEETEISIIPLCGGIMYQLSSSSVRPYAGFGVGYFQYKESTPVVDVSKGDIGYMGMVGCIVKIGEKFFFDLKASFSSCKVKPLEIEADLGGLKGGIGLGFEF